MPETVGSGGGGEVLSEEMRGCVISVTSGTSDTASSAEAVTSTVFSSMIAGWDIEGEGGGGGDFVEGGCGGAVADWAAVLDSASSDATGSSGITGTSGADGCTGSEGGNGGGPPMGDVIMVFNFCCCCLT